MRAGTISALLDEADGGAGRRFLVFPDIRSGNWAESRRAWTLARGLQPSKVNNLWYRKKTTARKHGTPLPEDTYQLPVLPIPALSKLSASPVPEPLPPPDALNHETGLGLGLILVKKEENQDECTFDVALLSDIPTLA